MRVTVKDYADSKGVTVQAVYKQLKRHEKELENHIHIHKKKRFLDEYAVDYLTQQSNETPTVILHNDQSDHIDRLEEENKNLLIRIAELQDVIIKKSEKIELLQEERAKFLLGENEMKHEKRETVSVLRVLKGFFKME